MSASTTQRSSRPTTSAYETSTAQPTPDDGGRLRHAVEAFGAMCRHFSMVNCADASNILSPFHSVVEPNISLADYLDRLDKHTSCGEEGVLLGMIVATRYCMSTKLLPSALSMHRLLLVGTRIGTKAHHDIFRSNRSYARAGGLELKEVNDLELLMLARIDYRAVVYNNELAALRAAMKQIASTKDRSVIASTLAVALDPAAKLLVVCPPNAVTDASPQAAPTADAESPASPSRRSTASGNAASAARVIRTTRTGSTQPSRVTSPVSDMSHSMGQSSLLTRSFQFAEQSMSMSAESVLGAPPQQFTVRPPAAAQPPRR